MLDFLKISSVSRKAGTIEIFPKFIINNHSKDLMIRGGDFYAIWVEELGKWSTNEQDVQKLIDKEIDAWVSEHNLSAYHDINVKYMWDADSGVIDKWHKYCQKQLRDNYHLLDEKIIFSNDEVSKENYSSKSLDYPLAEGSIECFDKIIGTLYSPEERHKLEWSIGAIVTGDSRHIQKFCVLYGAPGTGKSTILGIIQKMFNGYCATFEAKNLASSSNQFALEAFKNNPLVAIQHDGDLSRIEDNTLLNSLTAHEEVTVNEKYKSTYAAAFKTFLYMGTNKPVKITDSKSGLLRRLIDISPSGNKIPAKEYRSLLKKVNFELGAIAYHCKEVYLKDPEYYDDYVPISMMSASNDFYNFVEDAYMTFDKDDSVSLQCAWNMYKEYCDDAKVAYPLPRRLFKEELKSYFKEFYDRYMMNDGSRIRNFYVGFNRSKFNFTDIKEYKDKSDQEESNAIDNWIEFKVQESVVDRIYKDCPAQYSNDDGHPSIKWDNVKTTLKDIDTSKEHYVRIFSEHIVVDFDIPDENGNKSLELNLKEANKWPKTYAELSKSGEGIHLHYIYTGDPTELSRIYGDHIEIKIFTGKSSLRRKLTKCNDLPISTIGSGLPKKEKKKMINFDTLNNEKSLRRMIKRNLNKEIHPATKPSVDFIYKLLNDAYESGMHYDVSDMRNAILTFAANSTNQAEYCVKLVNRMPFKSAEDSEPVNDDDTPIVFFDVEVFPNLFLVNWKFQGKDMPVHRLINPKPVDIERLIKFRLIGFNNRDYDNHMLYACMLGYNNEQLYKLSTRLVSDDKAISRQAKFSAAYNISYTDVYDYCAVKQSLKKWEIQLGITHLELGFRWDQPVPKEKWEIVAAYCDNDVISTEAVFDHTQGDFIARKILAEITGMTVNNTTNELSTRFILGKDRNPQDKFNYRNMGEVPADCDIFSTERYFYEIGDDEFTVFNKEGKPVFPGYKYEYGKSTYRGEEVGEGGYVYAEPGIYTMVALLDVASMHPTSAIQEELFGPYTARFKEIKDTRVYIKHREFDKAKQLLDGALAKFLKDENDTEIIDALTLALKIVINSVYGLTKAGFKHPFRDPRNIDNIVAKRGALFMVNLKHEVQKRGFTVAHIKTDSIKIPNATKEIIDFVMHYGKRYGYDFEHEATYDRMCLVNDAVYIARYATKESCEENYGYIPGDNKKHPFDWTATGTQFQVPYVFKTLFTKEDISFEDVCEVKSVKKGAIYLDFNEQLEDVKYWEDLKTLRHKFPDYLTNPNIATTKKNREFISQNNDLSDDAVNEHISKGHDYRFVGRVGQFCPIKNGCNGGVLYKYDFVNDKYSAVSGSKGYRWKESDILRSLGDEYKNQVDFSYYESLANDAIEAIEQYGDFEMFTSDSPNVLDKFTVESDPLPF